MSYTYKYPHPAVTTDCVIFGFDGYELKVLLVQRGNEPFKGYWAFPGGFMNMDETVEECAIRELAEETALQQRFMKQFQVYSEVDRDPRERVITIAFYALTKIAPVVGGDDAAKAEWFPVKNLPQLAFDHADIFKDALTQLRKDIHFEPIGFDLLDEQFTMPQLQRLYEAVLGLNFDRRNFQKKMLQLGILDEIDEDAPSGSTYFGAHSEMKLMDIDNLFFSIQSPERECARVGRKPKKYSFNKQQYDIIKQDDNFKLEF